MGMTISERQRLPAATLGAVAASISDTAAQRHDLDAEFVTGEASTVVTESAGQRFGGHA